MLELQDYLRAGSSARFQWGVNDGATWLCDWAAARGHPDPLAPWRGYRGARQAARLVKAAGGVLALARAAFAGLEEIDPAEAASGDVGVGELVGSTGGSCGLIRTGDFWAGLDVRFGVVIGAAEILAAWRV